MQPVHRTVLGLSLSAIVLGFSSSAARAQGGGENQPAPQQSETPHKRGFVGKPAPKLLSPKFLELSNAWKGALNDYSTALLKYDRANATLPPERRDPANRPVHPAAAWWKRFEALARGEDPAHPGDPDALQWLVEQAPNAFATPAQRADAAEKAMQELARTHPDNRSVEDSLDALRALYEDFGRARFVALLDAVHKQATTDENKARALVVKAWAVSDRFKDTSPERDLEVQGIYDEILLGHPDTRAAREIAGRVETRLEREFLQAELSWIDAVRELQNQGKGPKDWPRQPMYAWNAKFLPVAAANGPEAGKFVNHVFPGYQQAEGNGIGFGLVWLQGYWMLHAPVGSEDWVRARLGLVEIVAREFHGQPLLTSALVDLSQAPGMLPLKNLEPALAPVLADGSAPKAHALALYLRAFAHISQNQGSDWQIARTDLEQLLAQHPTEDIAAKAQAQLASMTRVWPGAKAPDFRGTDQDGQAFTLLDYQGFVCVIDFGSAMGGLSPAEIKSRRELIAAYEGRPFRWIGGLLEPATQATFREKYAAAGVNWRCALLGTRQSDIAALWSVMMTPAVFVVDAQGVIRTRNLPWDEQRKLIEQLVVERESAGPKR